MNKIQKAEAVKNAINTFDDADFISIISENEVAVRNTRDGSVWTAKYFFENDEVFFNTSESEVIEEDVSEINIEENDRDSFVEGLAKLFSGSETIFSEEEGGIDQLQSIVSSYDFKKPAVVAAPKSQPSQSLRGLLEDSSLEVVDSIASKYEAQLSAYSESKADFMSFGQLFGEEGIKVSDSIVNPLSVINLYQKKQELKEVINEAADIIAGFYEDLTEKLGEDSVKLLSGIHLEDKDSAVTKITKSFVMAGRKATEAREAIKAFNEAHHEYIYHNRELFEEMHGLNKALPLNAVGDEKGTRFLKFGQGIFNRNDVIELLEDFDRVIATLPSMDSTAFHEIVGMRNVIDTMLVTNTIDDEVISEVVSTFNQRFSNVQTGTPIPSDGLTKSVPSYHGIPRSPAEVG